MKHIGIISPYFLTHTTQNPVLCVVLPSIERAAMCAPVAMKICQPLLYMTVCRTALQRLTARTGWGQGYDTSVALECTCIVK